MRERRGRIGPLCGTPQPAAGVPQRTSLKCPSRGGRDRGYPWLPTLRDERHEDGPREPWTSSATWPSWGTAAAARRAWSKTVAAGSTNRRGQVPAGTTVADFEEEEKRRGMSISAALSNARWQGVKVNLLDTPGEP